MPASCELSQFWERILVCEARCTVSRHLCSSQRHKGADCAAPAHHRLNPRRTGRAWAGQPEHALHGNQMATAADRVKQKAIWCKEG